MSALFKSETEKRHALYRYSADEIEACVREYAQAITIRTHENGCSRDETRPATKPEMEILYNCILGAVYEFRQGVARDACAVTAEMIADLFIPGMNGYLSVYVPIHRIIDRLSAD